MNQIHFYLHLQTHNVAHDECSSKNVLKDSSQRTGFLAGFFKDATCMIVAFSKVYDLARVLGKPVCIGIPDTFAVLGDLFL